MLAEGRYRYVFGTKAPSGFDASATHTIGIYGSRNLQEFELGTNYASTTFNFVPAGGAVTTAPPARPRVHRRAYPISTCACWR